ncbi:phosphatase [Anaerovibrio sp.]|uniref:Ppx/GppA phosphatase family protein n=1 Tax=Anaerovibrio sp. TaxID=1872532 RepID=UPI0026331E8F|nr:phosphatase [Anaerovibrio sp.]MDD6596764.1 phosphatase [Anaerovibrio sp.]
MYTIVDVGSNTIRMNVYDIRDDKLRLLFTKKATAGLASYVKDKRMSAAGIDRVVEVLEDFKETLANLNIPEMHVFATASLRNVENSHEAVAEIERRTGIDVQVLSGREEAELDFLGAAREAAVKKGLLVDIGGGSTELVAYKDGKIVSAVSIAKGSLNSYNKYVKGILPTKEERRLIRGDFLKKLDGIKAFDGKNKYKLMCGVGGTVRAALKLDQLLFGKSAAENLLQVSHVGYIIKAMEQKENQEKFIKNMGLLLDVVPDRIRTILPGMIILYAVAKRFKCESILVTHTGVREGFMYNYVLKKGHIGQDGLAGDDEKDNQAADTAQGVEAVQAASEAQGAGENEISGNNENSGETQERAGR